MRKILIAIGFVAIIAMFFNTGIVMAATTGELIALPAAHQPLMGQPTQLADAMPSMNLTMITGASSAHVTNGEKIYKELVGLVNTASPPSNTHSSQTSVVGAMILNNVDKYAMRTEKLLAHPLRL